MFKIIVRDNYDEVSKEAFKIMKKVLNTGSPVLGLATGSSPVGLYKEMIRDHQENGTSYQDILTFNLDEYVGLPRDHRESYWTFMHVNLFDHIDIPEDIQVLGIGSDGHIAFNEPGCPFDSETHEMELTEQTRTDNARFFDGDINQVPKSAVTMGLASIMRAKKIILIATGENKA